MDAGELSESEIAIVFKTLTQLMAPFAPFFTAELWEQLGQPGAINRAAWPEADAALAREDEIEVPVQVNGKLANTILVPAESDDEALKAAALADEKVMARVAGKTVVKVIVVKSKLVNLVVK